MLDLAIINGTIWEEGSLVARDIGLKSGKVTMISTPGNLPGAESTIDASGKYVLPGAIDSHFHCRAPSRPDRETFISGTAAAAHGGVTTVLEMPISTPATSDGPKIAARRALAENKILVDLGFYSSPASLDPDKIQSSIDEGAIAFKTFLQEVPADRVEEFDGICLVHHDDILKAMELVKDSGLVSVYHAEDHPTYTLLEQRLQDAGRTEPEAHLEWRPPFVEAISISTLILLAEEVGIHLHIPHVSSALSVDLIRNAKRRGVNVTAETCPQYLAFTGQALTEHGPFAKCNPPLKTQADVDALWEGLADGTIDTIATDHSPFTVDDKTPGLENIWSAPPGFPGVDVMLPFVMTAALNGKLSMERAIDSITTAPAKIFGLAETKGRIAPGHDADIVIYDPSGVKPVNLDEWHSKARDVGRIWHGFPMTGEVRTTIVRGNVIFDNGEIVASPGTGKILTSQKSVSEEPVTA